MPISTPLASTVAAARPWWTSFACEARWLAIRSSLDFCERRMVGLTRFELVTPRLSSVCSNQLSYRPKILTLRLQTVDCRLQIEYI
jgi:hypothetical protein